MIRRVFQGMSAQPPLSVPATPAGLRDAVLALDGFCAAEAVPPQAAWRLRVALDEVLANILHHGGGGRVEVTFCREADFVEIVIKDDGAPFDPLTWPAPDVRSSLEAREPGGLGIALLRGLIEDIRYQRADCNVLTLRTRVAGARARQES
jgi:serine/threonine-protein kinase RsbW